MIRLEEKDSKSKELRRRANARMTERERGEDRPRAPRSAVDAVALVHELQVHQIELEIRNRGTGPFAGGGRECAGALCGALRPRQSGSLYAGEGRDDPQGQFGGGAASRHRRPAAERAAVRRIRTPGAKGGLQTRSSLGRSKSDTRESCEALIPVTVPGIDEAVCLQMTVSKAPRAGELDVVAVDASARWRAEEQNPVVAEARGHRPDGERSGARLQ